MHELNITPGYNIQVAALDASIRSALGNKYIGISTYGPSRPISLWMDDSASPGDDATALATATAHDPVFISADKATIQADEFDTATITVKAPKSGAAAVTLSISVNGGAATDWPFTLVGGTASDTLTSLDPATIVITVKNPANRSTDSITITAK